MSTDLVKAKNRGRQRAQRLFAATHCVACGSATARLERHHVNGDPRDNAPTNVRVLCVRCHMQEDGRRDALRAHVRVIQPLAAAARRKWKGLSCRLDGCERPAKYKGLCNTHYYRARAHAGDPGTATIRAYKEIARA